MKPRPLILISLVTSLIALLLVLPACGAGDGISLEEYFRQLESIDQDADARVDALEQQFPRRLDDPAATRGYFEGVVAVFRDVRDRLDGMAPPDEVHQAHTDLLDATVARQSVFEEIARELEDAQSIPDVRMVLDTTGAAFSTTSAQLQAACSSLAETAVENAVDVDLGCQ